MTDSFLNDLSMFITMLTIGGIAIYAIWRWSTVERRYDILEDQWDHLVSAYNEVLMDRDYWRETYERNVQPNKVDPKNIQDPWL